MSKITSGNGWKLIPDNELAAPSARGHGSPKPLIRLEKRSGKSVTVISGLNTYGADRLNEIAKELKSGFGAGGTVKNGVIEIQGDRAEQIRSWFGKPR